MKPKVRINLRLLLILTILSITLSACGGGDEQSQDPAPDPAPNPAPDPNPEPDPVNYSANLSWDIPASRQNGDPLEVYEISGYHIHYRLTSDSEYTSILVNDPQTLSYSIENLSAGSYQFKVASFDIDDQISLFSTAVTATFGL